MFGRAPRIKKLAAVGKTVRCDVQHAHDERALTKHERTRRKFQLERFSAKHAASSLAQAAPSRSERKPLGKYPAMIVGIKGGGCDLHARCRREAEPSTNARSPKAEARRQEKLLLPSVRP